ncbi:SsrA-binding protein [Prevotella pallens ATCC 700821]|uniref:SsrA-binding protein n=1 Tax=Prevotella pallens ATCC 700821 TaxID=997353 RepID=F9DJD9_9BACT|nr:SsrA-binding protein [Prevotella pallens ATCC 700821]
MIIGNYILYYYVFFGVQNDVLCYIMLRLKCCITKSEDMRRIVANEYNKETDSVGYKYRNY